MERWTIKELKETDDITFAMCILSQRREHLNLNAPLSQKLGSTYFTLASMNTEDDQPRNISEEEEK